MAKNFFELSEDEMKKVIGGGNIGDMIGTLNELNEAIDEFQKETGMDPNQNVQAFIDWCHIHHPNLKV